MSGTAAALEGDSPVASRILVWLLARRWALVVWGAMVGWTALLYATVRRDYLGFRLGRFDLGNMVQAVWSTAHGRPLEMTDSSGEQLVRLGSHVDPILVLFTPLWWLVPSPLTLAAVQIGACALGALPVFWLARRHLGSERTAALMALAYLVYPWLGWTALDAMHPVTLAIPLFLYCIWFLDSRRLWAFGVCAALVLATGELMGLSLAALGVWYFVARRERRIGAAVFACGVLWSAAAVELVVPHFRHGSSPYFGYYAAVGGSPAGVARTLVTDPGAIWSALVTLKHVVYLAALAAPLEGMFFLAPGLAGVALPALAANALSSGAAMSDPREHYIAGVIPFLVAAAVFGLARLSVARRTRAVATILGLSLFMSVIAGPWRLLPGPADDRFASVPSSDYLRALQQATALVPPGVPVAATNAAGSHLSARRYVYSVPLVGRAQWIVLDLNNSFVIRPNSETWGSDDPAALRAFRTQVEASPRWTKVFDREGVLVFRRVSAA